MTTLEVVKVFRAKRVAKGKWMAKCPAHRDRMASLEIKEGKNRGTTIVGCYAGCAKDEVLSSVGLRMGDLFEEKQEMTNELRQRLTDSDRLDLLRKRNGLAIMMQALEWERRNYWKAVELNTDSEIRELRDKLDPEQKRIRNREERVQAVISEYGFDELMECVGYGG